MDDKELLRAQGEHMINVLNALDGHGNRFEFDTLYYYVSRSKDNLELNTIHTKYSPLALRRVSHDSEVTYHDGHFSRITTDLFKEPRPCLDKLLTEVAYKKQRLLSEVLPKIYTMLDEFKSDITFYDEWLTVITKKCGEIENEA